VLLNLFLAGILVGQFVVPAFIRHAPPQAGLVPRAELRQLPDSERRAFGAVFRRHMAEIRQDRAQEVDAKLAAEAAIGAPRFDRTLLETRFAAVRRSQLVLQTAMHEAVIDSLAALSAQSRATIARHVAARAEP
jgi:uncharacterized membrane protein